MRVLSVTMDRRIVLDEPEEHGAKAPSGAGPALFQVRGRRGQGVWRYSRGSLALLLGLERSAIHSAERRGEVQLGDFASVARFVTRRLEKLERRRMRDKRRAMSVNQERP